MKTLDRPATKWALIANRPISPRAAPWAAVRLIPVYCAVQRARARFRQSRCAEITLVCPAHSGSPLPRCRCPPSPKPVVIRGRERDRDSMGTCRSNIELRSRVASPCGAYVNVCALLRFVRSKHAANCSLSPLAKYRRAGP